MAPQPGDFEALLSKLASAHALVADENSNLRALVRRLQASSGEQPVHRPVPDAQRGDCWSPCSSLARNPVSEVEAMFPGAVADSECAGASCHGQRDALGFPSQVVPQPPCRLPDRPQPPPSLHGTEFELPGSATLVLPGSATLVVPGSPAADADRSAAPPHAISSKTCYSSKSKKTGLAFAQRQDTLLREGPRNFLQAVEVVVRNPFFESCFAFLIVGNTLVMIAEAQYDGLAMGNIVSYYTYDTPRASLWPGARGIFDTFEIVFGVIFTVEILLKMLGLRRTFVTDVWNAIDTIIVLFWFISTLGGVHLPVDPMLLRLARLVRLLRLLRLVRTIKGFDALYLMTTAMRGSMGVLFWSATLLLVVQVMMGLFLQMMLEPFLLSEDPTQEMKDEVFMYYGTFARATLTMFEITLGNWMPPCRALVENVHEGYMLFSLGHKLVIGFSVVTVITGVFIQETFKVATSDDKIMMMHKERAIKTSRAKMKALFEHADVDGNGQIGIEEFRTAMEDPQVRIWLSSMELDIPNIDLLFSMVDNDGNGEVTLDELVAGFGRLRGTARTVDLMMLHTVLGMATGKKSLVQTLR